MISLIRCDDRLIHGQCMTRLVQHFKIKRIIVVDDFTATNSLMKIVFQKAALPGMKTSVHTLEDSIDTIKESLENKVSTMVVFRFIKIAKDLFERIPELPKSVMVGPVAKRDGTKMVQGGTYLDDEEIQIVKSMVEDNGIDVHFQVVPDQKRYSWSDVKSKLL